MASEYLIVPDKCAHTYKEKVSFWLYWSVSNPGSLCHCQVTLGAINCGLPITPMDTVTES
jgi:hypothetical protein